ncbi:MAG: S8 family serine peptidase [Thaumarchaeota archaeon]|nr:S8 family serine peptidase [Nitrososphaerota archaeon]
MKSKLSIAIFSILLVSLMVIQPVLINAASPNPKANKIQGQYIIVLSDSSDLQNEIGKAKSKGAEILYEYNHAIKGFAVKVQNDQALENIKKNNPSISYVEPDYEVQAFAQTIPTGINRVDADLSSTISGDAQNSVNVDIAIIDTGIDSKHPDLNVYKQISFVRGAKTANDDNGHGTHVAGIAAAKDDSNGVVGVAPGARLWAVKVLDRNGSGSLSNVIKGIDYVTANAAQIDVANMSLGGEFTSSSLNFALSKSVATGVTYVVAAGNSAKDAQTFSPANHPDVIAISAIVDTDGKCGGLGTSTSYGADDTFASFSNFGSVVDMAAPGVNIYSTYKSGAYATLSGTSMASPHVAGSAALFKASNPLATPTDVRNSLLSNGSNPPALCDGNGFGYFNGDKDAMPEPLLYVRNY